MNENGRGFGSLNVLFLGVNITKLDVINLPFLVVPIQQESVFCLT